MSSRTNRVKWFAQQILLKPLLVTVHTILTTLVDTYANSLFPFSLMVCLTLAVTTSATPNTLWCTLYTIRLKYWLSSTIVLTKLTAELLATIASKRLTKPSPNTRCGYWLLKCIHKVPIIPCIYAIICCSYFCLGTSPGTAY